MSVVPLLSLEQWAALAEDEPGELVDGRLVEEEMPNVIHELIVGWLLATLRAWAVPRGGLVLGSETKLAVAPGCGRKPDVVVYLPGRRKPPGRASLVHEPPSLVVEVVSTRAQDGRRDRIEKVGEYAAFGVPYYWLLDPQLLTLEVLARTADGAYAHALGATEGLVTSVPGCEGLTLDLDGLWAEVARLDAENEEDRGGLRKWPDSTRGTKKTAGGYERRAQRGFGRRSSGRRRGGLGILRVPSTTPVRAWKMARSGASCLALSAIRVGQRGASQRREGHLVVAHLVVERRQ